LADNAPERAFRSATSAPSSVRIEHPFGSSNVSEAPLEGADQRLAEAPGSCARKELASRGTARKRQR
jgi:hypothetical protein